MYCPVQIYYNGDGGYLFVECMERCRVGPGQTGRMFALLLACLNLKVLVPWVFDKVQTVINLRSYVILVFKYTTIHGDDDSACIFVR